MNSLLVVVCEVTCKHPQYNNLKLEFCCKTSINLSFESVFTSFIQPLKCPEGGVSKHLFSLGGGDARHCP